MKTASRGCTDTRERFGLRRALVVVQVALSLVLVVGALLFVRSLRNLTTLDAGFRQDDLLIANLDLRGAGQPAERDPGAPGADHGAAARDSGRAGGGAGHDRAGQRQRLEQQRRGRRQAADTGSRTSTS